MRGRGRVKIAPANVGDCSARPSNFFRINASGLNYRARAVTSHLPIRPSVFLPLFVTAERSGTPWTQGTRREGIVDGKKNSVDVDGYRQLPSRDYPFLPDYVANNGREARGSYDVSIRYCRMWSEEGHVPPFRPLPPLSFSTSV